MLPPHLGALTPFLWARRRAVPAIGLTPGLGISTPLAARRTGPEYLTSGPAPGLFYLVYGICMR